MADNVLVIVPVILFMADNVLVIVPVISFMADNVLVIQSSKLNGIPLFLVKIFNNLRFEMFHCGDKCYITSLSRNYMTTVDFCSKLEKINRVLKSIDIGNKKDVIQQQLSVMSIKLLG